ncbi:hypothetical protein [Vreelandella populi]|uniref:hypothetical protein n=1 Tax=Vreelandella populi TaxID=2498858 RepID=UPI000F8F62D1|nr:hypothetical protein [Halomonas populi]RUR51403.1 hypothetical protein ELY40_16515 [Halomonas populi]
MQFYHFEDGRLVKMHNEIHTLSDRLNTRGSSVFKKEEWVKSEELEMVYTLYVPGDDPYPDSIILDYGYAFAVEDASGAAPWTIMVRDNPVEYLEALRLMEPLFTRADFLSGSSES